MNDILSKSLVKCICNNRYLLGDGVRGGEVPALSPPYSVENYYTFVISLENMSLDDKYLHQNGVPSIGTNQNLFIIQFIENVLGTNLSVYATLYI